jgi:hypothetical protein
MQTNSKNFDDQFNVEHQKKLQEGTLTMWQLKKEKQNLYFLIKRIYKIKQDLKG